MRGESASILNLTRWFYRVPVADGGCRLRLVPRRWVVSVELAPGWFRWCSRLSGTGKRYKDTAPQAVPGNLEAGNQRWPGPRTRRHSEPVPFVIHSRLDKHCVRPSRYTFGGNYDWRIRPYFRPRKVPMGRRAGIPITVREWQSHRPSHPSCFP